MASEKSVNLLQKTNDISGLSTLVTLIGRGKMIKVDRVCLSLCYWSMPAGIGRLVPFLNDFIISDGKD